MIVGLVHHGRNVVELTSSLLRLQQVMSFDFATVLSGPDIGPRRTGVLNYAAEVEDSLLWLDSDQFFEPEVIEALIDAGKPIVSALIYAQNSDETIRPAGSVLRLDGRLRSLTEDDLPDPPRLLQVAAVGMACTFVQAHVVRAMATKASPHLAYREGVVNGQRVEGDVFFCLEAKRKGYDTFIDTSVRSFHVKRHII